MGHERAIIFDLDDTLYPEREYAFSGFDAVADAFGEQLSAPFDLAARMRELFDTADRHRVFNVIIKQCVASDHGALLERMIEAFRNHQPRIQLHADADAALTRLRAQYKLGIITDGYAVTQNAKLDALGVRERVDTVIVTDAWGRAFWKPHPRAFEEMSVRLGVDPEHCTYVADNPAKDFVAPNALGWHSVLIARADAVHIANPVADGGAAGRMIATLHAL